MPPTFGRSPTLCFAGKTCPDQGGLPGKAKLLPLLASISREITERRAALLDLEFALFFYQDDDPLRARTLLAEIATHRRELRHVREEVRRLGATLVDLDPPVFRFAKRLRSSPAT